MISLLRQTNWKHFFAKNGPGEIVWKRTRGWLEQPNDLSSAFIVQGQIRGGPRGEGYFAAWNATEDSDPEIRALKELTTLAHFDSYAHEDCRCRMGLHWKCGLHKTWKG